MERYMIRIDGKVQGVWFRKTTVDKAKALGLSGFIQNEPDGGLTLEIEGNKKDLIEFVSWALEGPDDASVQAMTLVKGPAAGYEGMVIRG